jgi:hypothetical protein
MTTNSGVDLRMTIEVVYHAAQARQEHRLARARSRAHADDFAVYEPEKEDEWHVGQRQPNLVCAWLDPFWEGVAVHASADASSSSSLTRFQVCATLRPLPLPCVAEPRAGRTRTLCDRVKLQFFSVAPDARTGETRRDFLYALTFPLADLWAPSVTTVHRAYSYNRCDVSPNPIMGLRIRIVTA